MTTLAKPKLNCREANLGAQISWCLYFRLSEIYFWLGEGHVPVANPPSSRCMRPTPENMLKQCPNGIADLPGISNRTVIHWSGTLSSLPGLKNSQGSYLLKKGGAQEIAWKGLTRRSTLLPERKGPPRLPISFFSRSNQSSLLPTFEPSWSFHDTQKMASQGFGKSEADTLSAQSKRKPTSWRRAGSGQRKGWSQSGYAEVYTAAKISATSSTLRTKLISSSRLG